VHSLRTMRRFARPCEMRVSSREMQEPSNVRKSVCVKHVRSPSFPSG